jgi:rhodanese-related sulfurtransferase
MTRSEPMKADVVSRHGRVWKRMVSLFLASVALGWVYNHASPLGVRGERATMRAATSPSGYQNTTIAMSLELVDPIQSRQRAAELFAARFNPASQPAKNGAPKHDIPTIAWADAKPLALAGQVTLVDARAAAHYEAGHLPGAISLPANFGPSELAAFTKTYPRNARLIVYCGSAQCPLAHRLAELLWDRHGYTNIAVMPGGYAEYRQAETQTARAGGGE